MTTRFHFFAGHLRGPTGVRPPCCLTGMASRRSAVFLPSAKVFAARKKRGGPSLSKLLLFPCAVIGASACTARPFCQLKVNNPLRLFLAQNTSG
ncbi:hypothetical protein K3X44_09305 [Aliiroseovarius crassostreae]|uniref:hypothetical protein n=1 Tax=Aliiroseovarius crassostreae TaxID=154981 RepID=UPI002202F925|nr:hypothetical protein [Aliiroseovarius crassostreae]UWQ00727.1 hypothetical protein K3X44_09305 [Aliiroseovarius crassostreae]